MATNAAMVLAKPAKLKPRDIAEKLATHLASDARVTVAEVAGPGFLNMRLGQILGRVLFQPFLPTHTPMVVRTWGRDGA